MTLDNRPLEDGHFTSSFKIIDLDKRPFSNNLIDLNAVLNKAMQGFVVEREKRRLNIRYDNLPLVLADSQPILTLFNDLLDMLVKHPPIDGNLFLYIKCEASPSEIMDLTLEKGFTHFNIQFFTNITINENWQNLYQQKLLDISNIAASYKGSFYLNNSLHAGCVFSLTLPGKI